MPQISVGLALALSAAFGVPSPSSTPQLVPQPQAQTVKEYVQGYFADIPVMVAIAGCESQFRQYDLDGEIYRGVADNQDIGVMQINEHYHLAEATKLGYDLYSISGNVAFARYLYEKEGTAPWTASETCWDKSAAYKDSAKALATTGK